MPPVAKKAQPKVKPVEDVTLPDDDKDTDADLSAQVTPDVQADSAADDENGEDETDNEEQGTDDPDELVWVEEPCAVCFPESWPAQEHGAFVNCPHDHPIAFGDRVQLTKERASELGFGPR